MPATATESGLRVAGVVTLALAALALAIAVGMLIAGVIDGGESTSAVSAWFLLGMALSGMVSGCVLLGFAEVLARLRQLVTGERDAPPAAEGPPRRQFGSSQGKMFRRLSE